MPWTIDPSDPDCPADQPVGVRLDSTGELQGCHLSEADAARQVSALESAEQAVVDFFADLAARTAAAAARRFRSLDDLDLQPTAGMKEEADRGLGWRDDLGRGGTAVGIARARDISNGRRLSPDTVKRMHSFFARHEVDKRAKGFRPGEPGYPSNGRIAWALWGGDPGMAWASDRVDQIRRVEDENA